MEVAEINIDFGVVQVGLDLLVIVYFQVLVFGFGVLLMILM
jgi:hypothetical protein